MKDTTRRRITGLTAGLLLLLLISCNVVRAINGRSGVGSAAATAAAAPPGTLPLLTAVPGAAPAAIVPQQSPAVATVTPTSAALPGAASAAANAAASTSTSDLPSSVPSAAGLGPSPVATAAPAASAFSSASARPTSARPNAFSIIQGNALRATGTGLPGVTVRLRDARFGRIVETQTSDQSGLFAFRSVDPGVYIAEIVGEDGKVLAASQILNVTAGDTVSTAVRLPFRLLPLGGVLGDSAPAAAIVAAEAAAAGVLTITATDPVSPTQ